MPELPEVETIKLGLTRAILGKRIKNVEVRLPKMISLGPKTLSNLRKNSRKKVDQFISIVRNKKIENIRRRAKMLLVDLSGPYTMTIHLKLTGQLIYKGSPHKHTHVIFTFQDGSKLYFNDLRQFGYIRLVRDDELRQIKELQEYGPEPLKKEFTLNYLLDKAKRRPKLTIKQFLMEPKVVAGIGNIYSDEILYCAKIKPVRKVKDIKNSEWKLLLRCIPKILKEALHYQGSSVGDFLKVDGSEGEYGKIHRVYQRAGEECKKCGSIIKSVKLGGRTSNYCPKCQK